MEKEKGFGQVRNEIRRRFEVLHFSLFISKEKKGGFLTKKVLTIRNTRDKDLKGNPLSSPFPQEGDTSNSKFSLAKSTNISKISCSYAVNGKCSSASKQTTFEA